MNFIVDAMLPIILSNYLNDKGHYSLHTSELPDANRTTDNTINGLSIREDRVVITKDSDFENDIRIKNVPYKLLIIKSGNISNNELLEIFKNNLKLIISELTVNRLVEINPYGVISHF